MSIKTTTKIIFVKSCNKPSGIALVFYISLHFTSVNKVFIWPCQLLTKQWVDHPSTHCTLHTVLCKLRIECILKAAHAYCRLLTAHWVVHTITAKHIYCTANCFLGPLTLIRSPLRPGESSNTQISLINQADAHWHMTIDQLSFFLFFFSVITWYNYRGLVQKVQVLPQPILDYNQSHLH